MLVLRFLKNSSYVREIRYYKHTNACFQSTKAKLEKEVDVTKTRRFLKPASKIELKPINSNFIANIFASSFDKEILEYPQVFEGNQTSTIIDHSCVLEEFLNNNRDVTVNFSDVEQILSELKTLELFGLSIPQKYGGAGYNRTEVNFLLECSGIESSLGRFIGYNEDYGCRILNTFGNEEQKARFLPRLAEGKSRMCLAFIENSSFVDFSNFEGYSVTDSVNKGFILNAKKKWVHNADMADLILVLSKTTTIVEEEDVDIVKYNMLIVDRNTPGVKIHKVVSNILDGFNIFEIDFQDVFVPEENVLGNLETCGVTALKLGLSHCFLTDSVLCCSLVKRILQDAYFFIKENKILEKLDKGYIMIENNLSYLTMYAYVIESVVYLLSGRFDTHQEHDLFDESVLTKIIALDMLKFACEKYVEIVGCDSLKEPGILEEALKVLRYYSLMDENIAYLKMMLGGNGLCFSSVPLKEKVMKMRKPYDNFSYVWGQLFKSLRAEQKIQRDLRIKDELHSTLSGSGDLFEKTLAKFFIAVEDRLIMKGKEVIENENILIKFAETAAYLYAMSACLSRASSSVCYDFENHDIDLGLTEKFIYVASYKIDHLINLETLHEHLTYMYKDIGKITFNCKGYPAEHPLTRTY